MHRYLLVVTMNHIAASFAVGVVDKKKIVGILSMRDLYDYANNELQDSLKKHQEFMFGTGYGS